MTQKRALIIGVGGQDGSYLAELLLGKGYEVHGVHRRTSTGNLSRVEHLIGRSHYDGYKGTLSSLTLHRGDLLDKTSIVNALVKSQPDEVYNEADQDDVGWSYACPQYSDSVTNYGAGSLLDIVLGYCPQAKVFQPLSATIFGDVEGPHTLSTQTKPMSPYARGKVQAWSNAEKFRLAGLWVSTAVMYNHDSPRRGPGYLLQTLCRQAVEVAEGRREAVVIGDPEAVVDVGHARDYALGAWQLLQHTEPTDVILSTWWPGKYSSPPDLPPTVLEWAQRALEAAGVPPVTQGSQNCWRIGSDPDWRRPYPSPRRMYGDCSEARRLIGWDPKTTGKDLVEEIVNHWKNATGGRR